MDLLINDYSLSNLSILVTDFSESSPTVTPNTISFKGRNGKINFGGDYADKKATVTIYLKSTNHADYLSKQDKLLGLIGGVDPFFIQPICKGEVNQKRYYVTLTNQLTSEFIGYIDGFESYKYTLEFTTAGVPFAESFPNTLTVTDSIPYAGTTKASQLEVPFYIQLTAKQTASGISLTIGSRTWTYSGAVADGDVFVLGGMYNTKNLISINDYTNVEYFVLEPTPTGQIPVKCSIDATITINNYKELYL